MKKSINLFSFLAIAQIMMACNEDDAPSTFNIVGDWEIAMVVVGWGQPDMAGEEIPFTDTYTFNSDGTFIRNRVDGELEREGSGVYTVLPRGADDPSGQLYIVNLT